jgi:asparagine synthase (glutamine-hydrolysing)
VCGICGEWYLDDDTQEVCLGVLNRMCKILGHRGPDGQGLYMQARGRRALIYGEDMGARAEEWRGRVGLGHRRLSIIDLAAGAQPLSTEDHSAWIVFNGEIYNYQELRAQLEARGHRFSTHSDTETIIHLYEDEGEACVHFLNGMFAFAIWDEGREQLLLARDRFGIKPLFYAWDGRRLLFGSEIKAILEALPQRQIDLEALHDYLSLNYIPGPRTIYREIQRLQPGHRLVADKHGVRIDQYWDMPPSPATAPTGQRQMRTEAVAEELLGRLRRAVAAQMISDVPLGVFLSGGLDSSTLVALMSEITDRPVRTFSIGFEEATYNELPMARRVASRFGTDHVELIVRPDVCDLLPELIRSFDEPFADSSMIPTYFVSQLARSRVTTALGGDGGDEVFAGYQQYAATKLAGYYRRLPWLLRRCIIAPLVHRLPTSDARVSFDYKAKRFVEGADLPNEQAHFWWRAIFSEEAKTQLYRPGYPRPPHDSFQVFARHFAAHPEGALLDRLQYVDIKLYLPDDILVKVDRMSMAHSLEVRVPFLDHEVVGFVAALPADLRMRGLSKKYILRQAVRKLLPRHIVHGRKRGFNVPIGRWLRRELRDLLGDYLSASVIRRQGYFDAQAITDLMRCHHEGRVDYSRQLWGLLMFSLWHEMQSR